MEMYWGGMGQSVIKKTDIVAWCDCHAERCWAKARGIGYWRELCRLELGGLGLGLKLLCCR